MTSSDETTVPSGLEEALHEHVFSKWDQDFLRTREGELGKQEVLVHRYANAVRFVIPWLRSCIDLAQSRVVEIGCGSGSSTVALARASREVIGFDIDAAAVLAADARCRAYGVENVRLCHVTPEDLLPSIRALTEPIDVFILYAVLEHQKYDERIDTLSTLWATLPPGGSLVVVETPNRLVYHDGHTACLEFYHLLPDYLAFRYLDEVPRAGFRDVMKSALATDGEEAASERRIRWGIGASYHEFEIAIKEPLDELLVADGFEEPIVGWLPENLDGELLARFFSAKLPHKPIGFSKCVLNVVLRKPRSEADREESRRFARDRHAQIAAQFAPPGEPHAPTPEPPSSVPEEWQMASERIYRGWRKVRAAVRKRIPAWMR